MVIKVLSSSVVFHSFSTALLISIYKNLLDVKVDRYFIKPMCFATAATKKTGKWVKMIKKKNYVA